MTVTQDYQLQYSDTGLLLNSDAIDAVTPFFDLTKVTGLDMPEFRYDVRSNTGRDGGSVNVGESDPRTIIIEGNAYAPNASIHVYLEQLKTNFVRSNENKPFYYYVPGFGQRMIFAKSLGIKYDWDQAMRTGTTPIQIQLIAEDPLIYGDIVTMTTGLATGGGGYAFPKSFPYGYVAGSGSNTINAVNPGNAEVGAVIRFEAVRNPTVVSDTTGDALSLNVTIGGGNYYELDLRYSTVKINGVANRRNQLTTQSRWFFLQPGDNNLRFLGTQVSGTPQMTVTYRPGSY